MLVLAWPLVCWGDWAKNVATTITFYAWDTGNGVPKTGDAANLTAYVRIDGGSLTILGDTSATELSATNAPGSYEFSVAQAETNGDVLCFTCKSATAGIYVFPVDNVRTCIKQTGDSYAIVTNGTYGNSALNTTLGTKIPTNLSFNGANVNAYLAAAPDNVVVDVNAADVWNALTASYGITGSYGLLFETDLDATISSRSSVTLSTLGDKVVADMDANSILANGTYGLSAIHTDLGNLDVSVNVGDIADEVVTHMDANSVLADATCGLSAIHTDLGSVSVDTGGIADEVVAHMDANSLLVDINDITGHMANEEEYMAMIEATMATLSTPLAVNIIQLDSDATSLADLKDFIDNGYDPTNNRILRVYDVNMLDNEAFDLIESAYDDVETAILETLNSYDPPTSAELAAAVSPLATATALSSLAASVGDPNNADLAADLAEIEGMIDQLEPVIVNGGGGGRYP